jgi:drug/metabolite transporter (DMT)-like permease
LNKRWFKEMKFQHIEKQRSHFYGLGLCIIASFCLSFTTVFVKLGAKNIPVFELVFARGFGQFVGGLLGCKYKDISPLGKEKHRLYLHLRGIAGALSIALFYYGLATLPIADASGKL